MNTNLQEAASTTFRQKGSLLRVRAHQIVLLRPAQHRISAASRALIGLSNVVSTNGHDDIQKHNDKSSKPLDCLKLTEASTTMRNLLEIAGLAVCGAGILFTVLYFAFFHQTGSRVSSQLWLALSAMVCGWVLSLPRKNRTLWQRYFISR
jgi:hypothetical protein